MTIRTFLVALTVSGCGFAFEVEGKCFAGDPCSNPDLGAPAEDIPPGEDTDPTGDEDGDGAPNATDKCLGLWNPSQLDYDDDDEGDECDPCPFVSDREPDSEAGCYDEWAGEQLEGDWEGFVSISPAPDGLLNPKPLMEVEALAFQLRANDYSPTATPDTDRVMRLGSTGVLLLEKAVLKGGAVDADMDAVLLVDERREVAVGHLVRRSGKTGIADPPNLVVLTRQRKIHGGIATGNTIPETRVPADKSLDRQWLLYGWLDVEGAVLTHTRHAIQGRFQTQVEGDVLSVVGYEAAAKKEGFAWLFDADGATTLAGQAEPHLVFETGGDLRETTEGFELHIPLRTEGVSIDQPNLNSLSLPGRLSFSRDVAVLGIEGEDQGKAVRAFLVMVERSQQPAGSADPRLRPYALMGMHRSGSAIGLVSAPSMHGDSLEVDEVGLQFHGAEGKVSATVGKTTAAVQGSEFLGFNLASTFSTPLQKTWSTPRVCLFPSVSTSIGLMVACTSTGVIAADGCPVDRRCDVPVGFAIATDPAFDPTDYDLDGQGSEKVKSDTPCEGKSGDTCPCIVNPLGDCP